jgi:hypothetical protein
MRNQLKFTPAEELATLRYVVLLALEQKKTIESSGLSQAGQQDLQFIFPRTTKLAAISHAQTIAMRLFDERVRDRGYYHVFRFPTFWENQIHSAFRKETLSGILESTNPLEILQAYSGTDSNAANAKEGAHSLASLDLTDTTSIKTLRSIHADAIAAEKLVIPFFELA